MQFDLSARVKLLGEHEDINGQIEGFLMDLASTDESFFCDNLVDLVGEACAMSPFEQIRKLTLSSLYEVEYCPIFEFMQMAMENEDEAKNLTLFVEAAKEIAVLTPENIETKANDIVSKEEDEDSKMFNQLLKRYPSMNTPKLQAELIMTKYFEVAIGIALVLGPEHTSIEQIEGWSEPLSLHYAFDMKPNPCLTRLVQTYLAVDDRKELAETAVEFCRLEVDEGEPKSETDEVGRPSVMMTPRKSLSQPPQPNPLNTVERANIAKLLSGNDAHSAHWSRLKQKSLIRRNTDTDFSRLVDLPPMPPRLSQRSTSFESPRSMSKRKAVLVRVGDLDDSQGSTQKFGLEDSQSTTLGDSVYAWETPLKRRAGLSQSQTSSGPTQPSLVMVLETPPRASIGAVCSQRTLDFFPTKFSLL